MNKNQDGTSKSQSSNKGRKMISHEKKAYNKLHYEKNRSEILERARRNYHIKTHRNLNVVPLFKFKNRSENQTPPLKTPKSGSTFLTIGTWFLILLVLANTFFLVTETAHFYEKTEGNPIASFLKACLLEGAVIAFSCVLKEKAGATPLPHQLMIVVIYAYSVFAVSGSVIRSASAERASVLLSEKTVLELESEISSKTRLRDSLFGRNRMTLASQTEKSLKDLKSKLELHRSMLSKNPGSAIILQTLFVLIGFRILVMASNLLCLQELSRRFRSQLRASRPMSLSK